MTLNIKADVLIIPIFVDLESTFNVEGRVIDSFRTSLHSSIVEALICDGDSL